VALAEAIDPLFLLRGRTSGGLRRMDHVYKKIELTGSSPESMEKAVENAVAKAGESLRNLRWFEIVDSRGQIEGGRVAHWQVTVKIGFTLDD